MSPPDLDGIRGVAQNTSFHSTPTRVRSEIDGYRNIARAHLNALNGIGRGYSRECLKCMVLLSRNGEADPGEDASGKQRI